MTLFLVLVERGRRETTARGISIGSTIENNKLAWVGGSWLNL